MNSRRLMPDMGTSSPVGWRLRHRASNRLATTLGLPHPQAAAERAASPWVRPEIVRNLVGRCRPLLCATNNSTHQPAALPDFNSAFVRYGWSALHPLT